MIIDLLLHVESKKAQQAMAEAAQKAEVTRQANLEWVLADLIADIQAA